MVNSGVIMLKLAKRFWARPYALHREIRALTQSTAVYDPSKSYEIKVFDVEYLESGGTKWMARIYQPQGQGPFPAFLDVHGGAWQGGSRTDGEVVDQTLARSGVLVAAIDFRTAPDHKYPSQVADVNYGIRWLKSTAKDYNGDSSRLGALGRSSGGHTTMLAAMRPDDPRYKSIPLPSGDEVSAELTYFIGASPVLDSYARYLYAKESGQERLMAGSLSYFGDEETMQEGSPQVILDRREKVNMPPTLIIHGTADGNVPNYIPERFTESYRAAGGDIRLELFEDMYHSFVKDASPETDSATVMIQDFMAKHLAA